MSQDRLDQFFKDKFSRSDPAVPSSADWASARAMLDLEKKDNDRSLLWWLFLLGIINLLLVFSLDQVDTLPNIPHDEDKKNQPMADANSATHDGADENVVDAIALTKQKDGIDEIRSNHAVADDALDLKESAREETLVRTKSSVQESRANPQEVPPISIESEEVEEQVKTDIHVISKASQSDLVADDEKNEEGEPTKSQDPGEVVEDQARSDFYAMVESLEPVETRSSPLVHPYELVRPQPNGSDPLFDRPKFRQTKYGWSGSLLLNPGTQIGDPVQGIHFGFLAEYYIAKNWLVGSRPSMQITLNETGFSKFEVQTTFSFSAVNETYGLQASSLQFVSLPIYMAWTSQKHTIEFGGGVDWLMAARGQVQQVQIENQDVETLSALANGWIDTDEMAQFSSKLFIGYKFAINYQLKAGMTLFYNPTNLYPGFEGQQFRHMRKWFMGIQANYYLK